MILHHPSISSEQPNPVVPVVNLQNEESQMQAFAIRARKSQPAVLIGLIVNVFLAGLKTTIGILGHGPALLAEGINSTSDVKSVEQVHAHRFGPYLVVNLTIGVDGDLTVAAGDCIATQVENLLYQHFELVRQVYVHYHPVTLLEPCEPMAISRTLVNLAEKRVA